MVGPELGLLVAFQQVPPLCWACRSPLLSRRSQTWSSDWWSCFSCVQRVLGPMIIFFIWKCVETWITKTFWTISISINHIMTSISGAQSHYLGGERTASWRCSASVRVRDNFYICLKIDDNDLYLFCNQWPWLIFDRRVFQLIIWRQPTRSNTAPLPHSQHLSRKLGLRK